MSTTLAEDELLAEAKLPLLSNDARFGFNEFSRRAGDFAMAASLATYRLQSGKICRCARRCRRSRILPAAHSGSGSCTERQRPDRCSVSCSRRSCRQGHRSARRSSDQCRISARPCARRRAACFGAEHLVSAHGTRGSGMTWVGRAIRRLEDPALITGQGRFTADLPAAHWVRFVRSPVAAGKLTDIDAPDGAMVITAADLKGVKKITPMLHKFIQARRSACARRRRRSLHRRTCGRRRGADEQQRPKILPSTSSYQSMRPRPSVDARDALKSGAPQVHAEAPGNVILEGKVKTPDFDAAWSSADKIVKIEARSRRQNATPMEARGGHAAYDPATGRVTLTCTTQMPHLTRTAICDVLGIPGIRSARDCARRRRRIWTEDVARERICRAGVAGTQAEKLGRLDRRPPREPDRRLSFARSIHHARRRFRQECQAARTEGRHRRQRWRLFLLSHYVRRRAPDGDGRNARALRCAAIPVPRSRRRHEYLHDGALSRRLAPGDHLHNRAADGQGRARVRHRPDRHQASKPDRQISLQVGDGPGIRRGHVQRDAGNGRQSDRRARLPQASDRSARQRPLPRHRHCNFFRTHRLRQPGFRGARDGNHARMGNRHCFRRSIRLCRSPHRLIAARPGPAHHACTDHCRRARHRAR